MAGNAVDLSSLPELAVTNIQQRQQQARAVPSFVDFLREYVYLEDATTHETLRWEWWPVHEPMCADLQELRLVVLKARQLGWSWLLGAYALYNAQYTPFFRVLLLSQGEDEAAELLEKCRSIWRHLPAWLQRATTTDNNSELAFAESHGSIMALPATKSAGRSYTASLVIADEAAFHPYAAENYAAYKPTVDAGGQLIIVSTANGAGGFFHQLYTEAKNHANGFTARFYSWAVRPGRDAAWYEQQRVEYKATPGLIDQEYPSDDTSAFLLSGHSVFDMEAIRTHREIATDRQPLPYARLLDAGLPVALHAAAQSGHLHIWVLPQAGQPYVAGSDPAEGLEGGDYSFTPILNARTLEHCASLHGTWAPAYFTTLSAALAQWYNTALWGIERNNHGHTCLYVADQELRYPRLYWHADLVTQSDRQRNLTSTEWTPEPPKKLGWPTTSATKPGVIDDLGEVIAAFALRSYDLDFWSEAQTFVTLPNGKTAASPGNHDDRVMAMAIARRMAMQPGATQVRALPTATLIPRNLYAATKAWNW